MDAIASLITIIEVTAHIIRASSEYIRGVKGSTRAVRNFRRELQDFRTILELVEEQTDAGGALAGKSAETNFLTSIQRVSRRTQVSAGQH